MTCDDQELDPGLPRWRVVWAGVALVVMLVGLLLWGALPEVASADDRALPAATVNAPSLVRWERVGATRDSQTFRAAVPGGWLVTTCWLSAGSVSTVFVADPEYRWEPRS